MKFLLLIFTIFFFRSVYAQNLRYVVPSEDSLPMENLFSGELAWLSDKTLGYQSANSFIRLNEISDAEKRVPLMIAAYRGVSGIPKRIVDILPGDVAINDQVYTNTANISCAIENGPGVGGYDTIDPFASGLIAYVYIVPSGTGYECVLSSSANGVLDTNIATESLLVGAVSQQDSNAYTFSGGFYTNGSSIGGSFIPYNIAITGLKKNALCQELTVTNLPVNLEYGYFESVVFNAYGNFTALALYLDSGCVTKLVDYEIYYGTDLNMGIDTGVLVNNKFYVKGTISGSATTTPIAVNLPFKHGHFTKKHFKN